MMVEYIVSLMGGKTDHQLHHLADNEKVSAFFHALLQPVTSVLPRG